VTNNGGICTIPIGQTHSSNFNQAGGTLNIYGALSSQNFTDNGGTLNGVVTLNGPTPSLGFGGSAAPGQFVISNSGTSASIGQPIPAGTSVIFQPKAPSMLSSYGGTNNGLLTLVSANGRLRDRRDVAPKKNKMSMVIWTNVFLMADAAVNARCLHRYQTGRSQTLRRLRCRLPAGR
jgi:hypothetical protein